MPITVERHGQRKEHVVVSAGIAGAWLSEDAETRTGALNILVKMLASVAHGTRFNRDAAVTFRPDPLTAAIHLTTAATPTAWFSARSAAFVAPHLGAAYADLVIDGLEFAKREIANERAASRVTGDIGNVTRRASDCISAILRHCADWLGHRAGLAERQTFPGDDLPVRLQTRGLDRWIDLFGRNLAAVYEHEDAGLNMAVIMRLRRHVDQLLWALGIFVWLEEDDVRCVVAEMGLVVPRLS